MPATASVALAGSLALSRTCVSLCVSLCLCVCVCGVATTAHPPLACCLSTEELGTPLARRAAAVLAAWDRRADGESEGTLLFHEFMGAIQEGGEAIGE